jgi:hypothetical protein
VGRHVAQIFLCFTNKFGVFFLNIQGCYLNSELGTFFLSCHSVGGVMVSVFTSRVVDGGFKPPVDILVCLKIIHQIYFSKT